MTTIQYLRKITDLSSTNKRNVAKLLLPSALLTKTRHKTVHPSSFGYHAEAAVPVMKILLVEISHSGLSLVSFHVLE